MLEENEVLNSGNETTEDPENLLPGQKVSYKVALSEVMSWLDRMRVSERKKEKSKDSIDELVSYLMYGNLVFKDGFPELTLADPPHGTNGPLFEKLHFSKRYTVQQVQERSRQVKAEGDIDSVLVSASLATGVGCGPLSKQYTADFAAMTHIVTFF